MIRKFNKEDQEIEAASKELIRRSGGTKAFLSQVFIQISVVFLLFAIVLWRVETDIQITAEDRIGQYLQENCSYNGLLTWHYKAAYGSVEGTINWTPGRYQNDTIDSGLS